MKKLLVIAFALATLSGFSSAYAWTTADNCMDNSSCAVSINIDSGNGSKQCGGNEYDCSCEFLSCHKWTLRSSYCPSGWTDMGGTVTGYRCCHDFNTECFREGEDRFAGIEGTQLESTSNEANLESVFAPAPSFSTAYYGVVNSTNRSPSSGRGYSKTAKLDACVGYGNTNNMTGLLDCMSNYCPDSNKNSYCQQTGTNNGSSTPYAVCKDRCECQFNSANCENL